MTERIGGVGRTLYNKLKVESAKKSNIFGFKLMKREINDQSTMLNRVNGYAFKWDLANANKKANKNLPLLMCFFVLFQSPRFY